MGPVSYHYGRGARDIFAKGASIDDLDALENSGMGHAMAVLRSNISHGCLNSAGVAAERRLVFHSRECYLDCRGCSRGAHCRMETQLARHRAGRHDLNHDLKSDLLTLIQMQTK